MGLLIATYSDAYLSASMDETPKAPRTTSTTCRIETLENFLDILNIPFTDRERARVPFSSLTSYHIQSLNIFIADYDDNERRITTALSLAKIPQEHLLNLALFVYRIIRPFLNDDAGKKYKAEFIYQFISAIDPDNQGKMRHPIDQKSMSISTERFKATDALEKLIRLFMYDKSIKIEVKLYALYHLMTYEEEVLERFYENLIPLIRTQELEKQAQATLCATGVHGKL